MGMMGEFKEFAVKGNVLDMAVGVIIGGAFGKIVSSVVSDILMPPIGLLLGHVDFSSLFIPLTEEGRGKSLAAAKAAGAATINYGVFFADAPRLCHFGLRHFHGGETNEPVQEDCAFRPASGST